MFSLDSKTNGGSPEVSSTAFRTQPPDLQPVFLMDMDFAVICQLVQPQIRFLYIGSHIELSNMLGTQKMADDRKIAGQEGEVCFRRCYRFELRREDSTYF